MTQHRFKHFLGFPARSEFNKIQLKGSIGNLELTFDGIFMHVHCKQYEKEYVRKGIKTHWFWKIKLSLFWLI